LFSVPLLVHQPLCVPYGTVQRLQRPGDSGRGFVGAGRSHFLALCVDDSPGRAEFIELVLGDGSGFSQGFTSPSSAGRGVYRFTKPGVVRSSASHILPQVSQANCGCIFGP